MSHPRPLSLRLPMVLPVVLAVLLLPALLAACQTATQRGFSVPGCYDHGNMLEPSIHTVAECDTQGWQWHTQDWKKRVPAKPTPPTTR